MKIAVIQLKATPDKHKNIEQAVRLIKEAARNKAQFILLPEVFNYRGRLSTAGLSDIGEFLNGPTITALRSVAQKRGVTILAGSIYEKTTGSKKVFNTSVVINPRGKIAAKYRKINLFDAKLGSKSLKESRHFLAGNKTMMPRVGFFQVGLTVCYDLRFPQLFQAYGQKGADILCVPSCFTSKTGKAHWKVLLQARAIENLCYVLAPNQYGTDARQVPIYGHSLIIDPWGRVLAEAGGNKEQILYAVIDKKILERARQTLPGIHRWARI